MERIQKDNGDRDSTKFGRAAQGVRPANSLLAGIAASINNSPVMVAQRRKMQSLFGDAAQLQEAEGEALQGKYGGAQLKEASAAKPNDTELPDNLKNGIESLSGMYPDSVRVHYNSSRPAQLNAHTYAQGADIHVAPGQEQHLPHEAWHVARQAQGRGQPTMQMKEGVSLNNDAGLERKSGIQSETGESVPLKFLSASKVGNFPAMQLYRATPDGLESNGGKMEVKHNGNLWATSAGLQEANSKGTFLFEGDGTEHDRAPVTVKRGAVAEGAGNQQAGREQDAPDIQKWKVKALSEVVERVNEYVDGEVEAVEEDDEKMDFLRGQIGIQDEEEFQMEFSKRCSAWRHMLLDTAVRRIHQYAADPRHADASRLILITDCGVMAGMVSATQIDLGDDNAQNYRVARRGGGEETISEWDYHVAAPIMTDAGDYVTMETAAAKVTDFFSKPAKDRAWSFKMYGSQQGETFNDEYEPLLSGGREFDPEDGFI